MLILTPFSRMPDNGTVITCERGHSVAMIAGKGGGIFCGGDAEWPEIERTDGGAPILGSRLPITCHECGGRAIDWDRRFFSMTDLTPEYVASIVEASSEVLK